MSRFHLIGRHAGTPVVGPRHGVDFRRIVDRTVDVVGPEGERQFGGRLAVHHPIGLDVGDVIQIDAAHGQHPQILDHRHLAHLRHRIAVVAVFERDEGVEAPRAILQRTQAVEVVDTVLHPLDMTVEDRGIGLDAQPVGRFVHGEPFGRRPLVGTDAGADLLVEDLGAAARNRFHARFAQPSQPLFELSLIHI